jgi:serralysin
MANDFGAIIAINGTPSNDILIGTSGRDQISGNGGDDLIDPGTGLNDFIDGGPGIDTLLVNYSNLISDASFSFVNIENLSVLGGSGNDNFVFNDTIDTLDGGDGNDTLDAGALDDKLFGRNGDDKLFGGDGNDGLDGGDGNDYMIGGKGNNTLFGRAGNDVLATDDGNDFLDGGDGDDTLNAYLGNDFLVGGSGNDILIGNWGNDTISGGAGADQFQFFIDEISHGVDTILDANFAEGDKIAFGSGRQASINQFFYNGSTGAISFDANLFDSIAPITFATLTINTVFNVSTDIILF